MKLFRKDFEISLYHNDNDNDYDYKFNDGYDDNDNDNDNDDDSDYDSCLSCNQFTHLSTNHSISRLYLYRIKSCNGWVILLYLLSNQLLALIYITLDYPILFKYI